MNIPRTEQYVPQRRGDTKVAFGVVVVDEMVGRLPPGCGLVKTDVMNGEVAQPIGYVTEGHDVR